MSYRITLLPGDGIGPGVTTDLFGDILRDLAAGLVGGLGSWQAQKQVTNLPSSRPYTEVHPTLPEIYRQSDCAHPNR